MKRPLDKDYRNEPSATLTYLFDLEKYCDHIEAERDGQTRFAKKWKDDYFKLLDKFQAMTK